MEKNKNLFSENLKKIMFEKNLNQQEVADKIGVAQTIVSRWIKGIRNPSLSSVKKLSAVFDVPLNYFIGDVNEDKDFIADDKDKIIFQLTQANLQLGKEVMKLGKEILKEINELKNR